MVVKLLAFALIFALTSGISLNVSTARKFEFRIQWTNSCRSSKARGCLCFKKEVQYALRSSESESLCPGWDSVCFDFGRGIMDFESRKTAFDDNELEADLLVDVTTGNTELNGAPLKGVLKPFVHDLERILGTKNSEDNGILAKFVTYATCQAQVALKEFREGGKSKRAEQREDRKLEVFYTGRPEDNHVVDNRVLKILAYELLFVALYSAVIQIIMYLWFSGRFPFSLNRFPFNQLNYTQLQ
ncbi:hypothetical protein L596_019643 [Steinernema carpocapsae]|uniref:Uncharacterized protein n=1 Tax=Steinernema carpocapsae TaxID=34508 RepID=A0A4U5MR55_STECR|nr:hypothetical protein L596_019643 [Steinernema carpocapsae]